ncbi:hypothetical protein [Aquimarina rhabdastrellae]
MKKIYQFVVLLLLGCTSVVAQENDTYLYRFVSNRDYRAEGEIFLTNRLYHNLENNKADLRRVIGNDENVNSKYSDAFIIIPVEDSFGEVLIASAKKPDYFLRREGNDFSVEDVYFEKSNNIQDNRNFRWRILFAQDESIFLPGIAEDSVIVSIQHASDEIPHEGDFGRYIFNVKDDDGASLVIGSDNNYEQNNFIMQRIKNTF